MNFKQVHYFCAVVQHGTLARAAEHLFVAPTAISMQIAQLEQNLGGALFNRAVKPMALTDLGQFFLPRARELLAQNQLLEQQSKDLAAGRAGWLGLGFVRSLMYSILPKAVRMFRAQYPDVRIELVELLSDFQPDQLRSGRIHIGLSRHTSSVPAPPDLRHHLLFDDPFVVAIAADHPLAKKTTIKLADLAALPFILYPKNPASAFAAYLLDIVRAHGIEPQISNEAMDEIHTALGLVAAGMGYTIMGASVAQRGPQDLAFVNIAELTETTKVLAITKALETNPLVEAMLEILDVCKLTDATSP
jgi:LysR family transcriptional regulator, benzoate and cis,cis-muconate-responsive activator of ben and cat genes